MAATLPMFITVEACRTAFSSALSTLMANNIESRPEIIEHNNVYGRRFSKIFVLLYRLWAVPYFLGYKMEISPSKTIPKI